VALKTSKDDDQITRFGREIRGGTWLTNARQRSQRRKSPWNLLLPLFGFPTWSALSFLLGWAAAKLHEFIHPAAAPLFGDGPMQLNTALVLFPSLFVALCPAFLLTNVAVYLIPPARRAMNAEDRAYPGTGYNSSQRALSKAALWMCVICMPVVITGALLG
jgi:hypothetical protein